MKKIITFIAFLVLSLAGAAACSFSYSTIPDTPPSYYDITTIHHGATSPVFSYYGDGTRRKAIYEGIHPTGSQLMDADGNILEENVYALSNQGGETVLVVAETKYYTFWGQYHQIAALILLLLGLVSLASLILTIMKKPSRA